MRPRFLTCLFCALVGAFGHTPDAAVASTVLPMSLADLIDGAERIFLGHCVATEAEYLGDDLVTRVTFLVTESLKGDIRGETMTVLLPGGERDGIRHHIAGLPSFEEGVEAVLFLTTTDRRGRVWPVGLAQGDFRVHRPAAGAPRVRRDLDGLHYPGSARATSLPARDIALEELLQAVRSLAAADEGLRGSAR